ncbi:PAS domain-containing protein [Acidovorax sp. SUPP2522]|uniref:ATP-binding protein n=1 Tax=unclassified Acidovorax TaxID=2684926 RepID=UPI002349401E|nr:MULTISPECIES: ATP-binding protein [unclassified Acidovorax]WCM97750.1 PAS domain-containing protein [Acidovorax sp. GBBC 1281]GKT13378.1 PAS domain-containing protein [Acidovorax sp. SUPP2522]
MSSGNPHPPPSFLSSGGEMAQRIARHDWAATPLGPLASWPDHIRWAISTVLRASMPMATLWGESGVLIYNDAYAAFSGQRHPQLLGCNIGDAWPEAAQFNRHVVNTVLAGGTLSYRDQPFVLNLNGRAEPVWINLDYSPLLDGTGQPAGVLALVVDTTAKVQTERQLKGEQERFAQLFEQSPSFMAMLEGPEHRIVLANPGYLRLVGNRPLLGLTVAQALPDAATQGYVELLDRVYGSGEALTAYAARYVRQAEPGGPEHELYVDFVFQPIRDAAGAVTGIFVEGVDITERMAAEARREALARFSDQLRSLDSVDAVCLAAAETLGRTLKVSRAGYGAVDAAAQAVHVHHDWMAPGCDPLAPVLHLPDFGGFLDDLARDESVCVADVRGDARTRDRAPALEGLCARSFMNMPVVEHGQLVAMLFAHHEHVREWTGEEIAFMREVAARTRTAAERARTEAQLREVNESLEQAVALRTHELMEVEAKYRQAQKMEAIGQLTGGIAHDFNNLLGAMSASLQVLEKRIALHKFDNAERYIGMAQGSVRRAASLTQRLLAFSRRQTLDPKPVDVNRLIGSIEEMVRRTVGPGVEVEVVGAGGLWLTRVDPSQLENAVLNLCINARDAMSPQGGRLTIETANKWLDDRAATERELAPGQYISVCVTDTGAGMAPDVAARAFDPFFTTKPMGQGTGLGLSMVYGFVRQSGGQVRIYSVPGEGTTMCLYLPRYLGDADAEVPELPAMDGHRGEGEVVLVIEDESIIRGLIAEELENLGYRVVSVGDGPAGLHVLQSGRRVDLLLTDVGLPGGLNGRQVADAARVTRPGLKVLFITGYAENAVVGNGLLEYGMEVITKPFDVGALAAKVREMIER